MGIAVRGVCLGIESVVFGCLVQGVQMVSTGVVLTNPP